MVQIFNSEPIISECNTCEEDALLVTVNLPEEPLNSVLKTIEIPEYFFRNNIVLRLEVSFKQYDVVLAFIAQKYYGMISRRVQRGYYYCHWIAVDNTIFMSNISNWANPGDVVTYVRVNE